jgi:hypothetical protein
MSDSFDGQVGTPDARGTVDPRLRASARRGIPSLRPTVCIGAGIALVRSIALIALLCVPQLGWAAPQTLARSKSRIERVNRRARVVAGANVNDLVQTDKLTMHTVVRENESPRVLFATPAGNSGIGLWFKPVMGRGLKVVRPAQPITIDGKPGVELELGGPRHLEIERVMLDSMRALRDKDHGAEGERDELVKQALELFDSPAGRAAGATQEMIDRLSAWVKPKTLVDPKRPGVLILERQAFGSGATYRVEIIPNRDTRVVSNDGVVVVHGDGETSFVVRAFIDRAPLQPIAKVLTEGDAAQQRNLGLLVYKDKFLAGSYQYLTYFGRDTLISSKLLGPKLSREALETAVGSVLDRVSKGGRVAHEESNGDQATLEGLPRLMKGITSGKVKLTAAKVAQLERAIHDYKMVDGEFLLPSLLADYVDRATPEEMSVTLSAGRMDALARVVGRILSQTDKWSGKSVSDLVHLRRGQIVGNWRDSGEGLGGGRTPLDVNAYLVPSALEALERMFGQPGFPKAQLLARLPVKWRKLGTAELAQRRATWHGAVEAFEIKLDADEAKTRLIAYLDSFTAEERQVLLAQKLWSGKTIGEALDHGAPELAGVRFPGISLDARGKPTPIQSSDEAFQLFYGSPDRATLLASVRRMFQPFPVGLMTDVGLVVANAGYSNRPQDKKLFDRDHYHGAVVWSWPQTMMRRGLEKQLQRYASDAEVTSVLWRALGELDRVEKNIGTMKSAELWTWKIEGGKIAPVAFGASARHTTEGAALQLWSNTY